MDSLIPMPLLLLLSLMISSIVVWPFGLVECLHDRADARCRHGTRRQWLLLIFLMGALGSALYFLLGRPERVNTN